MSEDIKELLADVRKGVRDDMSEDLKGMKKEVTDEVTKKLEDKLVDLKQPVSKSEKEELAEQKNLALKYLKAKYNSDIKHDTRALSKITKDLDTDTSGSGDEFVPEYFGSEVIHVAQDTGKARQNSRLIVMPNEKYHVPTADSVTAYRVDQGSAITASSPTTGQVTLTAKKLAAMVIVTRELVEDANVDTLGLLSSLAGEALGAKEDAWAFKGLASGEGIMRNASVNEVTLGSGDTTFASIDLDDLISMLNQLDDSLVDNCRWLGSFSLFNSLRSKKDSNGRYLAQMPSDNMPRTLWDLPYIVSGNMPKTTDVTQTDTAFFACYDPRYLLFGDRRRIQVEFSREATVTSSDGETSINLFEQDMVAMKVTERIDIQLAEADEAFVRAVTSAS